MSSGDRPAKNAAGRRDAAIVPRLCEDVAEASFGALQSNVDAATTGLAELFASSFRKTFGDFELDEVEVNLKISADGKIGIVGSGVGVKGAGSMKLKFVRQRSSSRQSSFRRLLTAV
jgi:hypothetical protein